MTLCSPSFVTACLCAGVHAELDYLYFLYFADELVADPP
jgi:hypothetical protein